MPNKKLLSITRFDKSRNIQAYSEKHMTKEDVLREVGEWWDSHGTHLNDYDGIQILVLFDDKED